MSVEGGRGRSRRSLAFAALATGVMSIAAGSPDAAAAQTSPVPDTRLAATPVTFCGCGREPRSRPVRDIAFYVIDGVRLSPDEYARFRLRPEEIVSVKIMKEREAVRRYGAEAARGVVIITTKRPR